MAVFTTNQVRHLYVVNAIGEVNADSPVGTLEPVTSDTSDTVYFKYKSPGGVIRTDLIKKSLIEYTKEVRAAKMRRNLKRAVVTMTEEPIIGQDYIVDIEVRQFAGISDEETYDISASARAKNNSTKETIIAEIAKLLNASIAKDYAKLFTIEAEDEKLVITEVEQPWLRGTRASVPVYFSVDAPKVLHTYSTGNVEEDWATVEMGESTEYVGNGKTIADMEYFYMGERGDIYRYKGFPNYIPTTYLVDPNKEYDVFEVHYSYVGSNESVQKSEKDITFVFNASDNAINVLKGTGTSTNPLIGDIDQDGSITTSDVTLLTKMILDPDSLTDEERATADVNKDGRVNTSDVTALLAKILGGDTEESKILDGDTEE